MPIYVNVERYGHHLNTGMIRGGGGGSTFKPYRRALEGKVSNDPTVGDGRAYLLPDIEGTYGYTNAHEVDIRAPTVPFERVRDLALHTRLSALQLP